jgi:hypothetical protein
VDGWHKRSKEECDTLAARMMGGRVDTHILAQWYHPGAGGDERAELTLFEDGSVQLAGTAPLDLLTHVQAEWHNHLKGRIA